ncbi:Metal-dependent hydrolase, endonuclease/exonuclease/phosphatase family [Actinopolyspora lacussalsi subsp. righensis]|uniref:Metal-dependent hydrolase, endonuclease/exonuclease/phosphatase family n=1 Tax=Actinopolyspora righensis TaxID=995060 RepID=A0A1I6YXK0_9ACTN|nr:endonuclease [Actinopolyspora righensis]SFT55196.1 Metal-dependent hydrolase, endonuclease/exonuclease/phosphatase family [Actinopolyspora righensis]
MPRRSALCSVAALCSLALAAPLATGPGVAHAAEQPRTDGSFSALTYNVAGLPDFVSGSDPATNTPLISERLPHYDLINVQEDFNYHDELYAADDHRHRTETSGPAVFGDGLNTLSRDPITDFRRITWDECYGTDCLTPKGFSHARIELAAGTGFDLYNVHANAGTDSGDLAARRSNLAQLSEYIQRNSRDRAVIVMGDTNTRYTREGDNIRQLVDDNGLTDAWVRLERGGSRPAAGAAPLECDPDAPSDSCEVVDKILYRDRGGLDLTAVDYGNEHTAFLDESGEPLSDHFPHRVHFEWTSTE